jgi:hypothetical protein
MTMLYSKVGGITLYSSIWVSVDNGPPNNGTHRDGLTPRAEAVDTNLLANLGPRIRIQSSLIS